MTLHARYLLGALVEPWDALSDPAIITFGLEVLSLTLRYSR